MVQALANATDASSRDETFYATSSPHSTLLRRAPRDPPREMNQYLTCSRALRPCTLTGCASTRRFSGLQANTRVISRRILIFSIVRRDGTRLARLGAAVFATADGLLLHAGSRRPDPFGAVLFA